MERYVFLQYKLHLHLMVLNDISHRFWNDTKGALVSMGWWSWMYMAQWSINADYGPSDDGTFFDELQDMNSTIAHNATLAEPLLQRNLRGILSEAGASEHEWSDNHMDLARGLLLDENVGPFARRLPRVGMARWFEILDSFAATNRVWHLRQPAYMLYAVIIGLASSSDRAKMQDLFDTAPTQQADAPQATRASSRADALRARSKCSKTLCLCNLFFGDVSNLRRLRLIHIFAGPVRRLYGWQSKHVRSAQESLRWYTSRTEGAFLSLVADSLANLRAVQHLEAIGLAVSGEGPPEGMALEHWLEEEDAHAASAGEYVLRLLDKTTSSAWGNLRGLPGCFAGFCSEQPQVRRRCLAWVRQCFHSYEAALAHEQCQTQFWRDWKERSPFLCEVVLWGTALALHIGDEPSEALVQYANNLFHTLGQEKIC